MQATRGGRIEHELLHSDLEANLEDVRNAVRSIVHCLGLVDREPTEVWMFEAAGELDRKSAKWRYRFWPIMQAHFRMT